MAEFDCPTFILCSCPQSKSFRECTRHKGSHFRMHCPQLEILNRFSQDLWVLGSAFSKSYRPLTSCLSYMETEVRRLSMSILLVHLCKLGPWVRGLQGKEIKVRRFWMCSTPLPPRRLGVRVGEDYSTWREVCTSPLLGVYMKSSSLRCHAKLDISVCFCSYPLLVHTSGRCHQLDDDSRVLALWIHGQESTTTNQEKVMKARILSAENLTEIKKQTWTHNKNCPCAKRSEAKQ